MNWRNVKLICFREMRDQLRDRRTLFLIAVLPVLLYPLMGISFLQLSQFLTDHPSRIFGRRFARSAGSPFLGRAWQGPAAIRRALARRNQAGLADRRRETGRSVVHSSGRKFHAAAPCGRIIAPRRIARPDNGCRQTTTMSVIYFPADFSTRLKDFPVSAPSQSATVGRPR